MLKEQKEEAQNGTNRYQTTLPKSPDILGKLIVSEKPTAKWEDVVGLSAAKDTLSGSIILHALQPAFFKNRSVIGNRILLFGPPGTGKSLIVKAAACRANYAYLSVSLADVFYCYPIDVSQ